MNAGPATLATQDLPAKGRGEFPPTRWSMVLQAGTDSSAVARTALEALCQRYWYPLYAFVRRQGRAHHEAEDCTQAFLAQLLASAGLQRAHPDRGRFRTFLLTGLRNFLTSEWRSAHAAKRGGDGAVVSLNVADTDGRFALEPADGGLTPEQAFDRRWARDMIERTVCELREDYRRDGRETVFNALAPLVWGSDVTGPPSDLAARCGMSTSSFTVALHRLRRRLGERLRANVAETVADPADVDAELRHLIAAIREPVPGA
jgi:DNA-directed RNA polymerase specialized sigma24 family protein